MSYWARYKDEWDTAAESTVSSCRKRYVSTYLKYSHVLNPGSTHTGFESPKQNALYENSKESIRVVPNSVLACLFLQVTALTTKLSLYCLINLSLFLKSPSSACSPSSICSLNFSFGESQIPQNVSLLQPHCHAYSSTRMIFQKHKSYFDAPWKHTDWGFLTILK